jgi:hypothetical protein
MKHSPLALLALLSFGAAGCSAVKVYRTDADVAAAARPVDCQIEFLFSPPSRPYRPLGDLQSQVTVVPPGGAWLAMRPGACQLGADAVIVTRNQVLNLLDHTMVEGTAIIFTKAPVAGPEAPPEPAPAPVAATAGAPAPTPAPTPDAKPAP